MRTNDYLNNSVRMAVAAVLLVLATTGAAFAQTTVTATWDRNTDAYTTGYRVYWGTSPGNYQWNQDAGNQVSAPITLAPGSVYYFIVRAYNSSLQYGPPSNEATINLSTPPPPTPAPTASITATLQSANTARLTWSTTNATSARINGQTVALSGTSTVTVTQTTTYTLTATGAGGTATASATVNITAPTAPTASITATLQSPNSALVSWQTTNATSARINGQTVPVSGSTTVNVSQTTTYTLTATGAGGTATASATVTISNTAPGTPSSMASNVSGNRVALSWRAPTTGGTPNDYRLNVGTYSGGTNITNNLNVGNVLSVSGDLPRGRYYARVRAANTTGLSSYSNEVSFRVGRLLRTPTGFRVTWRGTTATLSWTAPVADTTADVPNNYVLEAGSAPGLSDVTTLSVGNTTSYSVDVATGTYYVRLKAVNDLGESDPTEDLEVRAPGSPNAPTYFMASGQGSQVDLRWTAPSGGSAPTEYVIEAGSAPGLADLAVLRVGNVTRFSTVAPPGVYYVRVRGVNAAGVGAASNEVVVRR